MVQYEHKLLLAEMMYNLCVLAFLSPNEYRRAWGNGQVFINEQNELEITLKAA
ncbi:MAG: hypothetical protein JRJ73_04125 [Deltaproteobacteria bacterium]|nr:hypothetical protein [Deltaproteobacteria bacterium]